MSRKSSSKTKTLDTIKQRLRKWEVKVDQESGDRLKELYNKEADKRGDESYKTVLQRMMAPKLTPPKNPPPITADDVQGAPDLRPPTKDIALASRMQLNSKLLRDDILRLRPKHTGPLAELARQVNGQWDQFATGVFDVIKNETQAMVDSGKALREDMTKYMDMYGPLGTDPAKDRFKYQEVGFGALRGNDLDGWGHPNLVRFNGALAPIELPGPVPLDDFFGDQIPNTRPRWEGFKEEPLEGFHRAPPISAYGGIEDGRYARSNYEKAKLEQAMMKNMQRLESRAQRVDRVGNQALGSAIGSYIGGALPYMD